MAAEAAEVLDETLARLLADKMYEKRKQAALEIEKRVREARFASGGGLAQVQRILDCLRRAYLESPQGNYKKGGLIGLASVAIGLEADIQRFLSQLVAPVLELFRDDDARVRYYACETLFNISKVAGEQILEHFNDVFDGLCKLYADVDSEVRTGVSVLDRLMKDIVTKWASTFRAAEFVPLLATRAQYKNPFVRQLVLAWIMLLLKNPDVDIVWYMPQFLEGLVNMLGDQSRDIRHNSKACLDELLKQLVACSTGEPPPSAEQQQQTLQLISDTAGIMVKCCTSTDACSRLTALCWLHEFVGLQMKIASGTCKAHDAKWIEMLPELLGGTLQCFHDEEEEIARMAEEMNSGLLKLVSNLHADIPVDQLVEQLLQRMQQSMQSPRCMVVRTVCLQWICMLLVQRRDLMLRRHTLDRLLGRIFETLLHHDDEVVSAALGVLAQIMEGRKAEDEGLRDSEGRDLFDVVAHRILELFKKERQTLQSKGQLIIQYLCGQLDARRLYVTVARAIQREVGQQTCELAFTQQLVQTFSWILFTARETKRLREELIKPPLRGATGLGLGSSTASSARPSSSPPPGAQSLFLELLPPWFHNPVSALALCLWAQQYELATELTARFAAFEPSLDLLKQLDQLVHLLESPVFSRLRLQLLEPRRHPALLKCLLGLAMILPQAGAFNILRQRLQVVQSGQLLEPFTELQQQQQQQQLRPQPPQQTHGGSLDTSDTDLAGLLEQFDSVTAAHQA